jgi:hypothetical protein
MNRVVGWGLPYEVDESFSLFFMGSFIPLDITYFVFCFENIKG